MSYSNCTWQAFHGSTESLHFDNCQVQFTWPVGLLKTIIKETAILPRFDLFSANLMMSSITWPNVSTLRRKSEEWFVKSASPFTGDFI